MRLDPAHSDKLARAFGNDQDGNLEIKLDIGFVEAAMGRLSIWEQGLFMKAIMRAARSRRRTPEQRVLLGLFVHQEDDHA
jgi:hypothetical protein